MANGPSIERTYSKLGRFSEILRIIDDDGHVNYDFAVVIVADADHPERDIPSIHPN